MKKVINKISIVGFAVLTLAATSCSNGTKTKSSTEQNNVDIEQEYVEQEVADFVYPMPTSFEVAQMLNDIGAAYIISLSNPAENVGKYLTTKSKAINLGIYGADLSYASTYNQKQITIDYMNASNQLVDELDFSQALDGDIVEKIEQNEDNKDELINYISKTFYDTYVFLNQNDRGGVAMLILAGSWIEGVFIVTNISDNTYNSIEMIRIVMKQKEPLNRLIELLADFNDEVGVDEMIQDLKAIQTIFNTVETESITEKQMQDITEAVKEIRNKYIS